MHRRLTMRQSVRGTMPTPHPGPTNQLQVDPGSRAKQITLDESPIYLAVSMGSQHAFNSKPLKHIQQEFLEEAIPRGG